MNLIDLLAGSQNNPALNQIARQFGLNDQQIRDVIGQVAPALGQGLHATRQLQADLMH